MDLRMSPAEQALFTSFLKCAKSYLEFGAGGSTVLASAMVNGPVCSVESDRAWIDKVQDSAPKSDFERTFIFADIGPTGEWGRPLRPHGEVNYLNYHNNVWASIQSLFDIYFVDGRFRVACFCQCALRCAPGSILAMHDYRSRKSYHIIEEFAAPLAEAEDLTFFRLRDNVSSKNTVSILMQYALDPT